MDQPRLRAYQHTSTGVIVSAILMPDAGQAYDKVTGLWVEFAAGDWLIRDAFGLCPCKPEEFLSHYMEVAACPDTPASGSGSGSSTAGS